MHNHLPQNFYIGNKKALYYHLRQYYELQKKDVFEVLPITYHIAKGLDDMEYKDFTKYYNELEQTKK